MREHIYTIEINEAFDKKNGTCPFCQIFAKLEDIAHRHGVDVVISASAKDDEVPEFLKKYIQE